MEAFAVIGVVYLTLLFDREGHPSGMLTRPSAGVGSASTFGEVAV